MSIIIYGIKNCDTMKKTFDWFNEHKIAFQFHDYKKEGISADKLTQWLKQIPLEKLVNRKGTTFKKLAESDQTLLNHPSSAIAVIMANTSVIKRPVIESPHGTIIGFDTAEFNRLR